MGGAGCGFGGEMYGMSSTRQEGFNLISAMTLDFSEVFLARENWVA